MRKIALLLAVLALPAAAQQAPPRVLTLETALANAREHQPQLRQARAATGVAGARADEANAPLLPQVAGSAGYERGTSNPVTRSGQSAAAAGESWSSTGLASFGVKASQLLWDFGATRSRYRAALTTATSAQDSERATELEVAATVRNAFFTARAARSLVTVAADTLTNQDKHLAQVQGFVEVGTKPAIDLAQARSDRANARVALITAETSYETAKATLNQAMGIEGSTDYDVADDSIPPLAGEDSELGPLLDEALAARPDLAAAMANVRAQELSVRALSGALWPSVVADAGVTDVGPGMGSLTWNWSASVGVSVPIFTGGQKRAQIREARWTLESLKATVDAARQQIRLDLEQSRLVVRAAMASLEASDDALLNAQELLRLAEGRYEAGVGTIIELGDAQVALTAAAQQKVKAEYALAQARAALLKALGRP
jgi:outer membrane protein